MEPAGDRAKSLQNTTQDRRNTTSGRREVDQRTTQSGSPPAASFQERFNQADFLEGKRQLKPAQLRKREYIYIYRMRAC